MRDYTIIAQIMAEIMAEIDLRDLDTDPTASRSAQRLWVTSTAAARTISCH